MQKKQQKEFPKKGIVHLPSGGKQEVVLNSPLEQKKFTKDAEALTKEDSRFSYQIEGNIL